MVHGATDHGFQYQSEARRDLAVAYYSPISGAGVVLESLRVEGGRRVGFVGLGAGVLAGYGTAGDVFRFYELNPAVIRYAQSHFNYLERSAAEVELEAGDGRLLLEKAEDASFDALILDAFSSDAIPVHLLTREAFVTYRRLLRRHGALAIHLTNRHMDLVPAALRQLAEWAPDWHALVLRSTRNDRIGAFPATYVVATNNEEVLCALEAAGAEEVDPRQIGGRAWSDDFSNPLEVLSWD
jgi:spermidine synthase